MQNDDDFVSKSQRKREANALFELGKRLTDLPASQLNGLDLPDDVRRAVNETRSIRQHIARKRQLQYLAKVLRHVDAEPIAAALEALAQPGREETIRLHRIEGWRDRCIAEGDSAVGELASRGDVDIQRLRQLIRQARSEAQRDQPPRAARLIFRLLRDLDEVQPLD